MEKYPQKQIANFAIAEDFFDFWKCPKAIPKPI
jgi:hypothetical protein